MIAFVITLILFVVFFYYISAPNRKEAAEQEKKKKIKEIKKKKLETKRLKYRDFVLNQFRVIENIKGAELVNRIASFYGLNNHEATLKLYELASASLIKSDNILSDDLTTQVFSLHKATNEINFRFPNFCYFAESLNVSKGYNIRAKYRNHCGVHKLIAPNPKALSTSMILFYGLVTKDKADSVTPGLKTLITGNHGIYLYLNVDLSTDEVDYSIAKLIKLNSLPTNSNVYSVIIDVESISSDKDEIYYEDFLKQIKQNEVFKLLSYNQQLDL